MMRTALIVGSVVVWLICFAVAMVTIIPLAAMSLGAVFDGSYPPIARLEAVGFIVLGLIVIAALLLTLTRLTRTRFHSRQTSHLSSNLIEIGTPE